ncbi:MAG: hypothetical protein H6591_00355 [Flavobacteriales bacterium]|nr:hypothetical protein [Flavobacteriales bacterium]
MRRIANHYTLGIGLGLLVFVLSFLLMRIPGIGYGVFAVVYALIFFAQGTFYGLTATHGRLWSTISFVVNFILWVTELVRLEHLLEGSSAHTLLYHNDSSYLIRFALGGALWASNKLVLDLIIDRILEKRRAPAGSMEV